MNISQKHVSEAPNLPNVLFLLLLNGMTLFTTFAYVQSVTHPKTKINLLHLLYKTVCYQLLH